MSNAQPKTITVCVLHSCFVRGAIADVGSVLDLDPEDAMALVSGGRATINIPSAEKLAELKGKSKKDSAPKPKPDSGADLAT